MKFESISIKNFRNFESIEDLKLDNHNIFFGMNDVGKSNFLAALRFVFDYNFRKNGFAITDFYNLDYEDRLIDIIVTIDFSQNDNNDEKLRSKARGVIGSDNSILYIKVESSFNIDLKMYQCNLYWGCDINDLILINPNNSFSDLDKLFNVIYIGSSIDIETVFRKNFSTLVKRNKDDFSDIQNTLNILKTQYRELVSVKSTEESLLVEYKKFSKDNYKLVLAPKDIDVDPYKNITPMLNKGETNKNFPLSGDGQRKITAYALTRLISVTNGKIDLFLIEEPENHLHRTSLLKMSKSLFNKSDYPFIFITTHSSELLSEMDEVNLIRIFGNPVNVKSCMYKVPDDYATVKNILNLNLAQALFYNKVLLVEGPSELILFEHVLGLLNSDFKCEGYIILPVNGTGFENYMNILKPIGIEVIVKTDNDIRRKKSAANYECLGLNRIEKLVNICNNYSEEQLKLQISFNKSITKFEPKDIKAELYENNLEELQKAELRDNIYLSKIDLENDLADIIEDKMKTYLDTENPVDYLQKNKMKNMAELVIYITIEDAERISSHANFKCLKGFYNEEN